jgi:hypothetical protein
MVESICKYVCMYADVEFVCLGGDDDDDGGAQVKD